MKKETINTWWNKKEIDDLELSYLNSMFDCSTQEKVDVLYSYAKFMTKQTLTPDNYPIYLKLFSTGNHWIVDALIGNNNPESFFKGIQPNSFTVSNCFNMISKWKKGEIYSKLFLVILGILNITYENPIEGYRIYPLTPEDVNNIGKQLNKEFNQKDPVNKSILHLLDRLADMIGNLPVESENMEKTANQANNIRGKFLDETKNLDEAIPLELLKKGDYKNNEIKPTIL